jgi:hypothetical protein
VPAAGTFSLELPFDSTPYQHGADPRASSGSATVH